jgi:hypothetical protein
VSRHRGAHDAEAEESDAHAAIYTGDRAPLDTPSDSRGVRRRKCLIPAAREVAPLLKSGRGMRSLLLILFIPLAIAACHADGLGVPTGGNPDGGAPGGAPDGGVPSDGGLIPCGQLTTAEACGARSDCAVGGCPDCNGSTVTLCFKAGEPPPNCPAIRCESPCAMHTDEQSCSADPKCYAVLSDPGTCDCAFAGCCMQFNYCEIGPPQCSPSAAEPPCGSLPWDCGENYDPVFNGACQIGCVHTPICGEDCRTRGCGAGESCLACKSGYLCLLSGSMCD